MSEWKQLWAAARKAAALLLRDRPAGEAAFQELLAVRPRDGMIFLERGKALAAIGERAAAKNDLVNARRFLPLARYKALADTG